MRRIAIPARIRWGILVRDGFACRYCGKSPKVHGIALEVDHVKAVADGGTNDEENLVTACDDCNRGKHDQPLGLLLPNQRSYAFACLNIAAALEYYGSALSVDDILRIYQLSFNGYSEDVMEWTCGRVDWPTAKEALQRLSDGTRP